MILDSFPWTEGRPSSLLGAIWGWHDDIYTKYGREKAEELAGQFTDAVLTYLELQYVNELREWNDDVDRTRRQVMDMLREVEAQLEPMFIEYPSREFVSLGLGGR